MSNFAEIFVSGYLLRENMAPNEIQTLTLAGVLKRKRKGRNIYIYITFHPADKIAQDFICRSKIEK